MFLCFISFTKSTAANRYDFCGIIMIFCLVLRHYTRTLKYYNKSSIFLVIIFKCWQLCKREEIPTEKNPTQKWET